MNFIGTIILVAGCFSLVLTMVYVFECSSMDQLLTIRGALVGGLLSWLLIKTGLSMNEMSGNLLFLPAAAFIVGSGLMLIFLAILFKDHKYLSI